MTWINPKGKAPATAVPVRRGHVHAAPRVDPETEHKLADFLVTHGRLNAKAGQPTIHLLGTCNNHDGTRDFAVRTFVSAEGERKKYDSTVRQYETGHMRLIR
jgi:hypothetical protein